MLEPTKKSPSALSLVPNPHRTSNAPLPRSNRSTSVSAASTLIRKTRRQSIPSSPTTCNIPYHTPLTSHPILLRAEPDSPISLHEWQRSINDRIKQVFPPEAYPPPPSPPPPVPKVPYGTVNMYTPSVPNPHRNTLPSSPSHKSLSQSVASNLSAALSSVTSPASRRKSRALSPSDMRRVREADQVSMTSSGSATPPPSGGFQQGYFDDDSHDSLPNAEKVLEQAMRFHQQRRNQRLGGAASMKSSASTKSGKESSPSSPIQPLTTPPIRPGATMPAMRINTTSPPNLSIASFEVLIKELEEEEEERKRKRAAAPPPVTQSPPKKPTLEPLPSPSAIDPVAVAQPRPRRPSALNDAKRRSTGSILLSNQHTPTFMPIDKENSFPFPIDGKFGTAGHPRRVSVASFGSQQSDSKRNSAHELAFNLVDWTAMGGGCSVSEKRASREYSAMMVRSNSVVSSIFGEFDESRSILSSYNFGRRGSVY